MEKNKERLEVIENIKEAATRGDFHAKVEINDPVITTKEQKNVILNYDILKNNPVSRIKRIVARNIAKNYTKIFNYDSEIIGMENLKKIKTGAIITSNHFSPKDSTVIMYATNKVKRREHLDIIVEEENIFMTGRFGFLMQNCGTIPISKSNKYLEKNFMPSVKVLLDNKDLILIYPEEQMWFNYKKPRPCKIGAYHIAAKFNVPVVPCFTELREKKEYDDDGFKKLKFVLHIMEPIYPDPNKSIKENKEEMRKKDYAAKVKAYEEAYGKKLDYKFEDDDIAGM